MNIYHIEMEAADYDNYDGFVVIAPSKHKAVHHVLHAYDTQSIAWGNGFVVTRIGTVDPGYEYGSRTGVVMSSYNAG